jgi:hypothetical protein
MDSMRHLSTSLPAREPAPAELLPDFKAAAQAVTTLYRNAATSQRHARTAGYQDALDDLLEFLDQKNLGLMDGEGWKVRQWATERLMGATRPAAATNQMADEDEEDGSVVVVKEDENNEERRSSSPETQRKHHPLANSSSDISDSDSLLPAQREVLSEPPPQPQPTQQTAQSQTYPAVQAPLRQGAFTFQSPHAYPTNHNDDNEMEVLPTNPAPSTSSNDTIRIIPRSSRVNKSHGGSHSRRSEVRNNAVNNAFSLGQGAGGKRKMPYQEYFDIHGLNDGNDGRKDGSGGGMGRGGSGKRGRNA